MVAVKRLKDVTGTAGESQFRTELEMISLAVHRNLLRLIGYCATPNERLLIYPYMSNGSVASRLRGWYYLRIMLLVLIKHMVGMIISSHILQKGLHDQPYYCTCLHLSLLWTTLMFFIVTWFVPPYLEGPRVLILSSNRCDRLG